MGPRSAVTRWRWLSATPPSTSSSPRAFSNGWRGWDWTCASGWGGSRVRPDGVIEEVRGEGLLIGLKLKVPPATFADAALERKLLLIPAGDNVVRVIPPLVVTDEEIAEGVRRLDAACEAVKERLAVAAN